MMQGFYQIGNMPLRLSLILAAPNKIIFADGSMFHFALTVTLSLGEKISVSIGFGIACMLAFFTNELA
jgi:hypothetical protein